tara:strand:- start:59 stop:445 length:387 start_codon:yes stop_codon:yes gene_type:complete
LTYAQTKSYNEFITWQGKSLLELLHINHIPAFLFQQGTLDSIKGKIYCNYRSKEKQSYMLNPKILTYNVNAKLKVNYIKILSMRRISEKCNYIPRAYLTDLEMENPFLTYDENYIYFRYESLVSENKS